LSKLVYFFIINFIFKFHFVENLIIYRKSLNLFSEYFLNFFLFLKSLSRTTECVVLIKKLIKNYF